MKQLLINEIGKRKERDRQKRDVKRGFESYTNHIDQQVKEYRERRKHIDTIDTIDTKKRDKTLEKQAIDGDISFLEYCDKVKRNEVIE